MKVEFTPWMLATSLYFDFFNQNMNLIVVTGLTSRRKIQLFWPHVTSVNLCH